ncbi:hypothetical protein MYCTH_2312607 [Thermothelomyces thermophilus ATCC 42464]|uniref:DUF7598 domain-containing protein n=1 Tax=Thermothelomyces thermophilus (strain ATCC 42464 / BCRC 31852 / DSM 1799) TaxID=573729 RepID=G2QN12_THET4|nr:uncharacterized protein MYCTH_2312607 [Thermothelomyces thermophilus ATCC 42464]AEO61885.1 hypothetical protein MYCTH_2312607 [Thermothelomyces thermophilus ATCC 42464]
MFTLGQDSKLLGAGHVVLNILRAFNMIGLAAVMLASLAMPVLSGINHHFFFFDMMTHVFVFLFAAFLFASELPVPWKGFKGYYERNWPVLGPDHSLAWLGWGMVFIGFEILGEAWKPAYTVETLGLDWWRAILAASILSATFGFFNICASVIFRTSFEGPRGEKVIVTSRQIRTHGKLAVQHAANKSDDIEHSFASHYSPPHRDNWSGRSWSKEEEAAEPSSAVRRLTRVLNPLNFNFRKSRISRIHISKPILPQDLVVDDDLVNRGHSGHGSSGHGADGGDRGSPVVPGLQRPPTALHPAYTGESRYSKYSAAHMDRF